jgi:hypothetical protein
MKVARIIGPQIRNLRDVVGYHFKHRHTTHTKVGVRNWIAELRRIDRASGYSCAVRQLENTAYPVYRASALQTGKELA